MGKDDCTGVVFFVVSCRIIGLTSKYPPSLQGLPGSTFGFILNVYKVFPRVHRHMVSVPAPTSFVLSGPHPVL